MTVLDEALQGEDLIVGFPVGGVEDWVMVAEVLLLEGLRGWVFPARLLGLVPEALATFGHRARIGVSGLLHPETVTQAVAAGAHFLTSPVVDDEVQQAAGETPFIPGALTPGEVQAAVRAGADAVQLVPAHLLGAAYPRSMAGLFPPVDLLVTGRIERYQADMWWQQGAKAVCTEGVILQDEEAGPATNDAMSVRRRCQNFREERPSAGPG
ncbi:MAG: bifunctional 4-hydroxy-2-oxoglutarate aldolase/2-dehydro-3-deoxy-phosphogluconate aldolase [Propioniciclava sp.]